VFAAKVNDTPNPQAGPSDMEQVFGDLSCVQLKEDAQKLFHHYTSFTAFNMMPFKDRRNPWLSFYPSLARCGYTRGHKSLLYAILAQAAGNLAHLGYRREDMLGLATGFYARAMKQLRERLQDADNDFTAILASVLTLIMAEV